MLPFSKWRILLYVLPLSGLFGIAKVGMHLGGWEPWAFDSLTGSLLGSATFVIALVLSGTLSDYSASKGMPSQIAEAIASVQDTNELLAAMSKDYDPMPLQQGLNHIISAILDWLIDNKPFTGVEDAIAKLNPLLVSILQIENGVGLINRIQDEQAKVRSLTQQMKNNQETNFVEPAYVLLWLFLSGSTVALLLIGAERFSETLAVSTMLFTSFFYLLLLIRDLDNPFDYNGTSSVDVDLSVLQQMRDRLNTSVKRCSTNLSL
jgi:hypothetical protein